MNPDRELRPEAFTIPCLSSVQPTQFTQVSPMVQLCLGDTHATINQQESPGQTQTTLAQSPHTLEIHATLLHSYTNTHRFQNSVIIYSSSCRSKPVHISFICRAKSKQTKKPPQKQKDILRNVCFFFVEWTIPLNIDNTRLAIIFKKLQYLGKLQHYNFNTTQKPFWLTWIISYLERAYFWIRTLIIKIIKHLFISIKLFRLLLYLDTSDTKNAWQSELQ